MLRPLAYPVCTNCASAGDFAHVVISNASHRGTLLATFVMSMLCICTLCACQGHLRFAVVQRCKILVARTNVVVYARDAYVAESRDRSTSQLPCELLVRISSPHFGFQRHGFCSRVLSNEVASMPAQAASWHSKEDLNDSG